MAAKIIPSVLFLLLLFLFLPCIFLFQCEQGVSWLEVTQFIVWIGKVIWIMYAEPFHDNTFYCLKLDIINLYCTPKIRRTAIRIISVMVWVSPPLSLSFSPLIPRVGPNRWAWPLLLWCPFNTPTPVPTSLTMTHTWVLVPVPESHDLLRK